MQTKNIKSISIKDYLKNHGINPSKEYSGYGMYLSPYRSETHPSLKVDYNDNLWRDFGTNEGGSIIDLVMKMEQCSLIRATEYLNNYSNSSPMLNQSDSFCFHRERLVIPSGEMVFTQVKPLQHPKLLAFLKERNVNTDIAQTYCKELHYQIGGRNYYAIGFPNDTGGFAMRNCSFKGCKSPNNITTFDRETTTVHLFEGFVDYLSLLTMQPNQSDVSSVILNSTGNLEKAIPFLSKHNLINAFLDNDEAGKQALKKLQKLNLPVVDISKRYADFKDVNDYLCGKKMEKKQPETLSKINKNRGLRR